MALEREEFNSGIASLKELLNSRCDGLERSVAEGFRRTNGRLDRAEDDIDELEADVAVLKDRGSEIRSESRKGRIVVGGIGAVAVALAEFARRWFMK